MIYASISDRETDELDRLTLYDIDPITGNVRSLRKVVGAVGGTDDAVTAYQLNSSGIMAMSNEETHYWFAKIANGKRSTALKALRISLGD